MARPLCTPTLRPSGREAVGVSGDSYSIICIEARTADCGRSKPAMTASPIVLMMVPDRSRMIIQDLEVLTNQKIRVHVTNAFIQRSRLLQIGEQVSHV